MTTTPFPPPEDVPRWAREDRGRGDPLRGGGRVVVRARADIESGRVWKARDRLTGHLHDTLDLEALDLLGQVHHDMGDLPAAGAAWFGTSRKGADVDQAIAAWRERHGDHFGEMWRSLPRSVRRQSGIPKLEALREKAISTDKAERGGQSLGRAAKAAGDGPAGGGKGSGIDAAAVIAWSLAAGFVACGIIGLVTILRWMVPG